MRVCRLGWLVFAVATLLASPASAFRYVAAGAAAPALTLERIDGGEATLPPAGRVSVILFWRAGQPISERALDDVTVLARELRPADVDVIAVADPGADRAAVRTRLAGAPVTAAVDGRGRAAEAWGVIVMPSTAIIGRDGRLASYLPGRTDRYPALVAAHVAHVRGELSDADLRSRTAAMGEPTETSGAYRRGVELVEARRWNDAATALAEALRAEPGHADAATRLGWVELERGRPADALARFEQALSAADMPSARMGRGIALLRTGRRDEGVRALEDAVVLNPEPVRAHLELAGAYEAAGDATRALEHYRWALDKLLQGRR